MKTIKQILEDFNASIKDIRGCSDGFCYFKGKAKGMHTNGKCRCVYDATGQEIDNFQIRKILRQFWQLREDLEDIK